jgi:predicted small metal-binding protein
MGVSIPCREIGGGCGEPIQGGSLDELVKVAAAHAVSTHGLSRPDSKSLMVLTEIRSAIPQTSRPRAYRSVNFTFMFK